MSTDTAQNLLRDDDNIIIVLSSLKGIKQQELTEKYYSIVNKKYDSRYTELEIEQWKRFYLDALKHQIIKELR